MGERLKGKVAIVLEAVVALGAPMLSLWQRKERKSWSMMSALNAVELDRRMIPQTRSRRKSGAGR